MLNFAKLLGALHGARTRVVTVALVVMAASLTVVGSAFASGPAELSETQLTALTNGAKEGSTSIVSTVFAILPYVLLVGVALFVFGLLIKQFGFKKKTA